MFIRIQQTVFVLNASWLANDRDRDHLHNCIHMLSTGQVHSVLCKQQIQDRDRDCHLPIVLERKCGAFLLSIEAVYLSNSLIKYLLGNIFSFILNKLLRVIKWTVQATETGHCPVEYHESNWMVQKTKSGRSAKVDRPEIKKWTVKREMTVGSVVTNLDGLKG